MQADIDISDGGQASYLSASTIALGYVVSVVDRAAHFSAVGSYGYALATLMTRPNSFSCRFTTADHDDGERSCTGIVINNTVHLANFPAFADAHLQDGLLDVMALNVGWLRYQDSVGSPGSFLCNFRFRYRVRNNLSGRIQLASAVEPDDCLQDSAAGT